MKPLKKIDFEITEEFEENEYSSSEENSDSDEEDSD